MYITISIRTTNISPSQISNVLLCRISGKTNQRYGSVAKEQSIPAKTTAGTGSATGNNRREKRFRRSSTAVSIRIVAPRALRKRSDKSNGISVL
ncbi:MAG: hypothetical protein JNL74_02720 [Fibrobacteres bacterium]|nr:hypothetical protein [Fibrobacterota bacterium]